MPNILEDITRMCQGNPGALSVLLQLATVRETIFKALDEREIHGSRIWVLFKDVCGEDINKLARMLLDPPPDLTERSRSAE